MGLCLGLNDGDRFMFKREAEALNSNWPPDIEARFYFYQRRGYTKDECIEYALAWAKNITEQAVRRRRAA